jgi:nucleoside-diphosphate-sugar epimerase
VTRVAVVGANGQVGAEVCLLLRRIPGVEVVPISRTWLGSGFLRYRGVACRHGSVSDPTEAPALLGDCDLVANFALSQGQPSAARRMNARVIENTFRYSAPGATVVFFSTQNVYGDPAPTARIRWKDAYGQEKLWCERVNERLGRRFGKAAFALRLGHVCGDLQGITQMIRDLIVSGPIAMPEGGAKLSNTVYTATIVDALLKLREGRVHPGIYDLMSVPQWTWRQVYEFEAARSGLTLAIDPIPGATRRRSGLLPIGALPKAAATATIRRMQRSPKVKEIAMWWLSRFPESVAAKAQAAHFRTRARTEIAALDHRASPHDALDWVPNGRRFVPGLTPTVELLATGAGDLPATDGEGRFPPDLAPHRT